MEIYKMTFKGAIMEDKIFQFLQLQLPPGTIPVCFLELNDNLYRVMIDSEYFEDTRIHPQQYLDENRDVLLEATESTSIDELFIFFISVKDLNLNINFQHILNGFELIEYFYDLDEECVEKIRQHLIYSLRHLTFTENNHL